MGKLMHFNCYKVCGISIDLSVINARVIFDGNDLKGSSIPMLDYKSTLQFSTFREKTSYILLVYRL